MSTNTEVVGFTDQEGRNLLIKESVREIMGLTKAEHLTVLCSGDTVLLVNVIAVGHLEQPRTEGKCPHARLAWWHKGRQIVIRAVFSTRSRLVTLVHAW